MQIERAGWGEYLVSSDGVRDQGKRLGPLILIFATESALTFSSIQTGRHHSGRPSFDSSHHQLKPLAEGSIEGHKAVRMPGPLSSRSRFDRRLMARWLRSGPAVPYKLCPLSLLGAPSASGLVRVADRLSAVLLFERDGLEIR